jgi:hypothetical protein
MTAKRRVDFADLRSRADFRAVLAHDDLTPKGRGDQVKIPCPFHDDAGPSCSANLAKGVRRGSWPGQDAQRPAHRLPIERTLSTVVRCPVATTIWTRP